MDEKKYTLEDVETLRSKTGIGYEEAVGLLEKYDGDMARALIELEKRGKIENQDGKIHISVDKGAAEFVKKWWNRGLNTRVIVERKEEQLINLSVLFMLLALLLGWRLVVVSALIALLLGCRVTLRQTQAQTEQAENAAPQAEVPAQEAQAEPQPEEKKDGEGYNTVIIE